MPNAPSGPVVNESTKRTADEAGLDDSVEEQGHSAGGGGGGGTPYQPLALQKHLGNRKSHNTRFVYSGTTFVGASYVNSTDQATNVWYRFPWEFTQQAIRAWESYNISERYLFWKAHHISIEFKNPICVQDVGSDSGEVTAGQNLHAQLFAYQDNLYTTGIANTFDTRDDEQSNEDIDNLLRSFGNHGYDDNGVPVQLPRSYISRNSFAHNFPDVKQCGMGGGNRIAYQWNMSSPYWRSTMELYNQATDTLDTFQPTNFVRWDEQFGRIGMYADDSYALDEYNNGVETACPQAWIRGINRNLRNPSATSTDDFWTEVVRGNTNCADAGTECPNYGITGACANAGYGFNQYYRDPEPIPQLWLQLQPQLSSITQGLGNSVAQVQFEVHIDIELMGQCPSILEATTLVAQAIPDSHSYARRWINNMGWKMPIFYPIVMTDDRTEEN